MREAEQFLKFALPAGSIIELRMSCADGSWASGYFDDFYQLWRWADHADLQKISKATYYTINAVMRDAVRGNLNRMAGRVKQTTRDSGVAGRYLYLIDIDPTRPSGVCSTGAEKAAAWEVADRVHTFLASRGWPEPIIVDSGNGYHLLYRGEGSGFDAKSPAWRFALNQLAQRFDSDDAHVDRSVFNPARIARLPGSWNRKGEDTPERPHRQAKVMRYPETWEPVTVSMIFQLACEWGYGEQQQRQAKDLLIDEDGVLKLIAEFPEQLQLRGIVERDGAKYFCLESCPFAGRTHNGDKRKTALVLGDGFGFSCWSDDCANYKIGDLLQLLREQTGRSPSMRIWGGAELTEKLEQRFGGIQWADEIVPAAPPIASNAKLSESKSTLDARLIDHEARQRELAEWQYDNDTHVLAATVEINCPLSTDPAEWGLDWEEAVHDWVEAMRARIKNEDGHTRRQLIRGCTLIYESRDLESVGRDLGRAHLFQLARQKNRPVDKHRFVTAKELMYILAADIPDQPFADLVLT